MAIDNSPRERQAAQLARKRATRTTYDRILIVAEGEKTEYLYFNEIRSEHKIQTANVEIQGIGQSPIQIVDYAEQLLLHGDAHKGIVRKSFEKVFAVFDRDDHPTFHQAIEKAARLDDKYKNNLKQKVSFQAIPSVPCFELWFLLHFQNVDAPIHRRDVYRLLKGYLPAYEKNLKNMFAFTQQHLAIATQRADLLKSNSNNFNGVDSITLAHELVKVLLKLKS